MHQNSIWVKIRYLFSWHQHLLMLSCNSCHRSLCHRNLRATGEIKSARGISNASGDLLLEYKSWWWPIHTFSVGYIYTCWMFNAVPKGPTQLFPSFRKHDISFQRQNYRPPKKCFLLFQKINWTWIKPTVNLLVSPFPIITTRNRCPGIHIRGK